MSAVLPSLKAVPDIEKEPKPWRVRLSLKNRDIPAVLDLDLTEGRVVAFSGVAVTRRVTNREAPRGFVHEVVLDAIEFEIR